MDAAPTPSPVSASAPPTPPDVVTAWPPSAQWATAFLIGVAATLLVVHCLGSLRWGTRPTERQPGNPLGYQIDLNQAELAELRQLPRVGQGLAQRILDHRNANGSFRSVDDLRAVQGIGPTTLEQLRPLVKVVPARPELPESESAEAVVRAQDVPVKLLSSPGRSVGSRPPGKKEENLKGLIDVNRASQQELQRLPGIGPALSKRILDERAKRPFQSVDELRRVSGIGPKTLEKLRPHVTVGVDPQRVAQSG